MKICLATSSGDLWSSWGENTHTLINVAHRCCPAGGACYLTGGNLQVRLSCGIARVEEVVRAG